MNILYAVLYDRALRRERRFRDRLDPLSLSDEELISHYRFPRNELIRLIDELRPYLQRRTMRVHAVPTHTQVLVALRILASGSFQHVIGDTTGTHIAVKAPSLYEAVYINRKRYHSLNIQVVCNSAGKITSYCARFPGSTHDAFIWYNSDLRQRFTSGSFGDYLLLGDSGYPLEAFLLTPVRNPATAAEARYNRAHTRTRIIIEQTFGMLKNRFRCLHKSGGVLQYSPLRCAQIIISCILLHNRCIGRGIPQPQEEALDDGDQEEIVAEGENVDHGAGRAFREEIIQNWFQ